MAKKAHKSKTIWLNAIVGLIAVAELIEPNLLTALGVSPERHQSVLTIVGVAVAVINIYLRTITSAPVELKK